MAELNKGKNTGYQKGYDDGMVDGRKDGIEVKREIHIKGQVFVKIPYLHKTIINEMALPRTGK